MTKQIIKTYTVYAHHPERNTMVQVGHGDSPVAALKDTTLDRLPPRWKVWGDVRTIAIWEEVAETINDPKWPRRHLGSNEWFRLGGVDTIGLQAIIDGATEGETLAKSL